LRGKATIIILKRFLLAPNLYLRFPFEIKVILNPPNLQLDIFVTAFFLGNKFNLNCRIKVNERENIGEKMIA
jgi:hypothetical protein